MENTNEIINDEINEVNEENVEEKPNGLADAVVIGGSICGLISAAIIAYDRLIDPIIKKVKTKIKEKKTDSKVILTDCEEIEEAFEPEEH